MEDILDHIYLYVLVYTVYLNGTQQFFKDTTIHNHTHNLANFTIFQWQLTKTSIENNSLTVKSTPTPNYILAKQLTINEPFEMVI